MSFLVISGSAVSIAQDGVSPTITEVGERARAFDGSMRSAIRARKRGWALTTTLLARAAADTLVSTLTGTPPLTCSGDLLGTTLSCFPEYQGMEPVATGSGPKYRVKFTLHEA